MFPPVFCLWRFTSLAWAQAARTFVVASGLGDYLCISDSLEAQLNARLFLEQVTGQLGCSEAGVWERVLVLLLLGEASGEVTPASPTGQHTPLPGTSSAKGERSGCPTLAAE